MTRAPLRRASRAAATAAVAAFVACLAVVAGPAAPASAADPLPNPTIPAQCGLGVTLVLDASGSVQTAGAVSQVRTAAEAFLEAFADTGSTARVLQFASLSEQLAPRAEVTNASLASGGAFRDAIDRYYNPLPPQPGDVEIKRFNSGNPQQSGSWVASNSSTQYTNWDQSLRQTAADAGDLVVYITDGDPTAYDFTEPGDPFSPGPPPDVGVGTDRTSTVAGITLDRAVTRANAVKLTGARILAVGVGEALQNDASVARLTQISGNDIARTVSEFDVETTDVALVADFADLASAVRALVLDLCSPSLTIRKFAQSASDATYAPAGGWDMTVTPTVPGGFNWVLPQAATGPSATVETSPTGFAQFQWEPIVPDVLSGASVTEVAQPGFTPGRPGPANDFRCEFRNEFGGVREVAGELSVAAGEATFELTGIGNEIGTCSVYNSFVYAPGIAVTKVNSPTEVRGDLVPPASVTSSYAVTNTGNTPLSNLVMSDDRCSPVTPATGEPNSGDVDGDGKLDLTETWVYSCERVARAPASVLGALNLVNTITVQGTDPSGAVVSSTAQDDVDVYIPSISLTKLVNGEESVTIVTGEQVTYTYAATNTGDTPLGSVQLVDDTPPCTDPDRDPDPNGNEILDVGETWNYSCPASPASSVDNTATVSGAPLNPVSPTLEPFPGPPVTATDVASVDVQYPDLQLVKTVSASLVFPGTAVTYTYVAMNAGTADLALPAGRPDWIADDRCAPVVLQSGDDGDGLMNPGESWTFTCGATITVNTLNTAEIQGQPVVEGLPAGDPLSRTDQAVVLVVSPSIEVVKTALTPVVVDPAAGPVSGPDFPDPRPAQYAYEVTNTGFTPIEDVALVDDTCSAVTGPSGDEGGDGVLGLGEVWQYTCETPLERSQGAPPPTGAESAIVQNTAEVMGIGFIPGTDLTQAVSDTDIAQVLVIEPAIALTKVPTVNGQPVSAVRDGTAVTYVFEVTNTGDVALVPGVLVDDKCGPPLYRSGDTDGDGLLEGANSAAPETWIFTCERTLDNTGALTDVNVATVSGVDPLGNVYEAAAQAEVSVIDPAIALVKEVSDHLVLLGSQVTYTFTVTNVGTSPDPANDALVDVNLFDIARPPLPDCRLPDRVDPAPGADDVLDRDDTWVYACTTAVNRPTLNLATVTGHGGIMIGLDLLVADTDVQAVATFQPGIAITKTADPTAVVAPGGNVTYTYAVTNTGDVPLANVAETIADDTCSPIAYVSGDTDADGLLDTPDSIFEDEAEETWIFRCATFVSETTVNTAVVTGTPVDPTGDVLCEASDVQVLLAAPFTGCDVDGSAQAIVRVVPPLPPTGGEIAAAVIGIAALMLALGLLLVATARARRR